MDPKNNNRKLEDAIHAMKNTAPTPEELNQAKNRVFSALREETPVPIPDRLRSGDDFSALLAPYLRNELSEAQRMLVEDRLNSDAAYRRQLDRMRGNVREMIPAHRQPSTARSFLPWAVAAGVLFAVGYLAIDSVDRLLAPSGARAEIASVSGEIFRVSAAGLEPVKAGTPMAENEPIRTAKGSSAVVRLPDGSLIEMNERSELSISAAYSGSTIRLDRGNIVVQAAKQKRGALKVATRESTVSVKGTIFSVAAGLRGTQVAVVEGRVIVEQAGTTESLLPGQSTGSEAALKRTTVPEQIAWSKDATRYLTMLNEVAKITKQIKALPLPALRMNSKLLPLLPADTVVYVAIPNLTGTVADATKIFEDRLNQSPVLKEWWDTKQVSDIRELAEKLRSAGAQIGDEIVVAATMDGKHGPGHPVLIAEVKGAGGRTALETQIKEFTKSEKALEGVYLSDRYLIAGSPELLPRIRQSAEAATATSFAATPLAATIQKSYDKGAGWILAVDMEQIFAQSVSKNDVQNRDATLITGINGIRHLLVEHRDNIGRGGQSDTRASLNFSAPRTGVMSWLAAPAPMPSLDYISPDATFAISIVTKNARQMAEEFFSSTSQTGAKISEVEKQIGINVIEDLAGPLGGEITMALDGPLLPVPTYVFAVEVYDPSRLSATLAKLAKAATEKSNGSYTISLIEETVEGRNWYRLKVSGVPAELHFSYANGYLIGAPNREAITKALQNRQTLLSLPRSQRFRELLPVDSQVNASGIFYFDLGSKLQGLGDTLKNTVDLTDSQKQAVGQLTGNQAPVLICAYAGTENITVASSSGFFGFGLDTLLSAGRGAPILPQLLSSAMGRTAPVMKLQERKTKTQ
ncbi:FecR family protein [Bryobacter aggregatus]|uniref:FecR family protein n=1 Tax=Bryobacter aggregatus TaxID=360054 RepID=UPI0004E10B7C|nr:FecR family protein [Bryobacter aggregatus]